MSSPVMVPMLSPDGRSGDIPQDRVQDALGAGFKQAVPMVAPDGRTTGYIPAERVQDARAAGFKPQVNPKIVSSLTANPKGEGTYTVTASDGRPMQVPYSQVPVAQQLSGFALSPEDNARYEKDAASDPHRPSFWNALTNPVGSGAHAQGVVGGMEQVGGQAIKMMAQPALHPIDTVKGVAKVAADYASGGAAAAGQDVVQPAVQQYLQDKQQGGNALALENLAGNVLGNVEGGRVMAAAAAPVAGAVGDAAAAGANGVRRLVAGDVNAPIAGTDVTPAARYESMKAMGVQPNAAEATNSTPLKIAEKVNQNSLTAAGTYADTRAANLKALNDYTEDVLGRMSNGSPEEGGAAVQQALLKAHTDLKSAATEAYQDLDSKVGNQPLAGAKGLREMAKDIVDSNSPYYKAHPELEPTKAMAIVRDLAGAKGSPRPAPAVIPGFGPEPPPAAATPAPGMTYSELHRLRSDLLDFNNTNPDLVKNMANGWISRLAAAADHAITSGESALTPEQVGTFRNANSAWKFMKDTFDNPSHPLYQAVRSTSPSTLVNGISRTPEMAKLLQTVIPEDVGPIQRGVAESLLKSTKEGGYNFKTFQGQWNKLPEGYREALFSPEQRQELGNIGNVGTVLNTDLNPSGSARLGQGIAEGAEFLKSLPNPPELAGNLAYHGGQFGLGRLMNSPKFVDWLMRGRGFEPGGEAPAAQVDPRTGPQGQPNFYSDLYLKSRAAFDAARSKQQ